jgi:hypothetical protein
MSNMTGGNLLLLTPVGADFDDVSAGSRLERVTAPVVPGRAGHPALYHTALSVHAA